MAHSRGKEFLKTMSYNTAKTEESFSFYVRSSVHLMLHVAGVTFHDYYTDPRAGIKVFGADSFRKADDMFDGILEPVGIGTPAISYGHLSSLGFELVFPDGMGEVNYVRQEKSPDEWIQLLQQDISLSVLGQFFLDYRDKLKDAYPGRDVSWNMGYQGPLTSAYELRDMDIFCDPYDDMAKTKKFLDAVGLSTSRYIRMYREINGVPQFMESAGMCDDVASMFPPKLWEELVLPYWDRFYRNLTDGTRHLHCEDMTVDHVKFLDRLGISRFDPSVSHKLTPGKIKANTSVPFAWRLVDFHYSEMTRQDVRDWVFKAVEEGASEVFTYATNLHADNEGIGKVKEFHQAAGLVQQMMKEGATREDIGKMVSQQGRKRFFDNWPHPREMI
ncbi:MAG: hypothetical protein R6W96_06315 [Clostridia bacterium]